MGDFLAAILEELLSETITSDKAPKLLRFLAVILLIGLIVILGLWIYTVLR